jgi:hypothetical protein
MPEGEILNERESVVDERESARRRDAEQNSEAKRGNRTGLVTAILRHHATCLQLKLGGGCKEISC